MITIYYNWYQLNDNGLYDRPDKCAFTGRDFRLFCMAVYRARLLDDGDTLVFVTHQQGYKVKLSHHKPEDQNYIIDALIPLLDATDTSDAKARR